MEFRKRGELNEQPLKLALERARMGDLPLAFPGKVLSDGQDNRLFIADSTVRYWKLSGQVNEARPTVPSTRRASSDLRAWPWLAISFTWPTRRII
jgi:hypothetical protein